MVPSPRYANCIAGGKQTIQEADNAMQVPADGSIDEEFFAVLKEQALASKCEVKPGNSGASSSFFWTVMSQNGNAPASLGSDSACLPQVPFLM